MDTNQKSASPAKVKNPSQPSTPQMNIQRVNKGAQQFKGSEKTGTSRKQKKISEKVIDQAMKDTVLQNIQSSTIEEKRQEAKLRRSLEETVEFFDNNRMEELLMEYFEERENWNQVPDENNNYLAPILA
ncbi:unnamed protein product [Caenorhabditis nigoni]